MKLSNLKYEIIVAKPAIDLKEGVFYDKIDGYVIKLGKKERNDSVMHDIVIFEKRYGLQDNFIMAASGVMRVSPNKKYLEFIMYNGWRYQERGARITTNTEFTRLYFKEYKKVFDLKSFQMNKGNDIIYDPKMLSVRQLNTTIDSLETMGIYYKKRADIEVNPYLPFAKYADSIWPKSDNASFKKLKKFTAMIPDSLRGAVSDKSINQVNISKSNIAILEQDYLQKVQSLRNHEIEWHRKFTLSVACLVLFLIGAPLGAIIRKGGLGMPLVFAIIFFVVFHLLNTFGEKFAKAFELTALQGMWLSTLVLIPIGAFLTYKAMKDSQLFNQEYYYRTFKRFRLFLANFSFSKRSS